MINLNNETHVRNLAILVLLIIVSFLFDIKTALIYLAVGLGIGLVYRFIYMLYTKYFQKGE